MKWWQIQEKNFYSLCVLLLPLVLGIPLLFVTFIIGFAFHAIYPPLTLVTGISVFMYSAAAAAIYPKYIIFIGIPLAMVGRICPPQFRRGVWLFLPIAIVLYLLLSIFHDKSLPTIPDLPMIVSVVFTPLVSVSLLSFCYFMLLAFGKKLNIIKPSVQISTKINENSCFKTGWYINECRFYVMGVFFFPVLLMTLSLAVMDVYQCNSCKGSFFSYYGYGFLILYFVAATALSFALLFVGDIFKKILIILSSFSYVIATVIIAFYNKREIDFSTYRMRNADTGSFLTKLDIWITNPSMDMSFFFVVFLIALIQVLGFFLLLRALKNYG